MEFEKIRIMTKSDFTRLEHKYSFDDSEIAFKVRSANSDDVLLLDCYWEAGRHHIKGVMILNENSEGRFMEFLKTGVIK